MDTVFRVLYIIIAILFAVGLFLSFKWGQLNAEWDRMNQEWCYDLGGTWQETNWLTFQPEFGGCEW